MTRNLTVFSALVCAALLSSLSLGADRIELSDGTRLEGDLVELGGSQLEMRCRGGSKVIRRRDIVSVDLDQGRVAREVAKTDAVINADGFRINGKVEELAGGQQIRVTLAGGARVVIPRAEVSDIILAGQTVESHDKLYTVELARSIDASLQRVIDAEPGQASTATDVQFLSKWGIFAIDRVRAALADEAVSAEAKAAFEGVARTYELKRVTDPKIEAYDTQVFDVLTNGTSEEKRNLLVFLFFRFADEVVPLAVHLALSEQQDDVVRGYSIDFLRRTQRNRELVDIYNQSAGRTQFASAVALCKNQILLGLPTIIEALELAEPARRMAIGLLREFTDQTFRFRPDGAPEARRQAISRWWNWWTENEERIRQFSYKILADRKEMTPEREKATQLWEEASRAYGERDVDYALERLEQARSVDPLFLRAHICLAMIHIVEKNDAETALTILQATNYHTRPGVETSDRFWLHLYEGHCHRRLGDQRKALAAYEASILHEAGQLQGTLGFAELALQVATGDFSLTSTERETLLKRSLEAYEKALAALGDRRGHLVTMTLEDLPLSGELAFDRRTHNRSVVQIRKAYRQHKFDYLLSAARIRSLLKDHAGAIDLLSSELGELVTYRESGLKEHEVGVRNLLGYLYEQEGRGLDALRQFQFVLKYLDKGNATSRAGIVRLRSSKRHAVGN